MVGSSVLARHEDDTAIWFLVNLLTGVAKLTRTGSSDSNLEATNRWRQ
jgi:hypothetical protein